MPRSMESFVSWTVMSRLYSLASRVSDSSPPAEVRLPLLEERVHAFHVVVGLPQYVPDGLLVLAERLPVVAEPQVDGPLDQLLGQRRPGRDLARHGVSLVEELVAGHDLRHQS